jgi:alpha-ketoglutarate-dependent taurine dioxygenase
MAEMASANAITVDRITSNVGAVIGGLDLRRPLAASAIDTVRQAIVDHGVVFMRGGELSMEEYWAFTQQFGQPMKEESTGTVDNTAKDLMTGDMVRTRYSTAVWHADTTSLAEPPIATVLRAAEVPPFGGDTCWSSMYAAWDALSDPMKAMLDGLTAVHSIDTTVDRMSEFGPGFESNYTQRNARQQVHPVVLTHPESGRKALYINEAFTCQIVELDRLESTALLQFLFRHVERPDFTMRWKWTAGDIAFWDNRSVQHYAVPDYTTTRLMQRIVLAGVKPGLPSALVGKVLA